MDEGILIGTKAQIKGMNKYQFDPLKTIQFFTHNELTFNMTKSVYNSQFELMPKNFGGLQVNKLPILFTIDPVIKY